MNQPWIPGDIVLDSAGDIRVRTADPDRVWDIPDNGDAGTLYEHELPRPLTLLVRAGCAIGGQVVSEVPPHTNDVGPGFVFMMASTPYRVIEASGDEWECVADTGATTRMSAADIARRKGTEYV